MSPLLTRRSRFYFSKPLLFLSDFERCSADQSTEVEKQFSREKTQLRLQAQKNFCFGTILCQSAGNDASVRGIALACNLKTQTLETKSLLQSVSDLRKTVNSRCLPPKPSRGRAYQLPETDGAAT
jgi:hypothetical protein